MLTGVDGCTAVYEGLATASLPFSELQLGEGLTFLGNLRVWGYIGTYSDRGFC